MSGPVTVAALLAAGCALLALPAPRLVAALPEPVPVPEDELDEARAADPPKESWVDLAAVPGLGPRCAVAAAVVGAVVGWRLGADPAVLPWLVLVPVGVVLAVIDWRTRLLPKRIIWPAYAAALVLVLGGLLLGAASGDLVRALLGSAAAFVLFAVLWFVQPGGLGYGDVRLAALLGLVLGQVGWGELVLGLWSGFFLGAVAGLVLRATKRLARKQHVAFGPFMLLGAVVGVLWGNALWASMYG